MCVCVFLVCASECVLMSVCVVGGVMILFKGEDNNTGVH